MHPSAKFADGIFTFKERTMDKFKAINKVMVSDLRPEDKCLMVELERHGR